MLGHLHDEAEAKKHREHIRRFFERGKAHGELRESIGSSTPLFLSHGGGTRFSEQEKLTNPCLGGVFDPRTSSMETHWPFFVVRVAPWPILAFGSIVVATNSYRFQ